MSSSRQLAAIMFTDIVGYTTLMGNDEQKAFEFLRKNREIQKPIIELNDGRWIKEMGDGVMATFNTVSDAVNAAIKIQQACKTANDFQLRIGIHLGEVVFEADDVFGDGVNIAARIQAVAKPGSIYASESVHHNVANKKDFRTRFVKEELLKNVERPVRIYDIVFRDDVENIEDGKVVSGTTRREINPSRNRVLRNVSLVLLLLSLIIGGIYLYNPFKEPQIEVENVDPSVAVLAFSDLSPDHDHEWFSDGLTEELLNSLTNLHELKVTARTSSFYFKGKDVTVQEIAQKLGVNHVVEGSVRKIDNQLRITVQLIRAKDGFHIWSKTYDRASADFFKLQTDIAGNIATSLLVQLSPEKQAKLIATMPTNIEAYEYFLRGYKSHQENFQYSDNINHFQIAEKNFLNAISLDPSYSEAYGALADLYDTRGNDPKYRKKFWHLRDSVMQLGYRLNPNSIQTLIVYGYSLRKRDQPNLDSAFNCVKKAYQIAPNSVHALRSTSGFYKDIGLIEQSIIFTQKALVLDPLNVVCLVDLADAQIALGTFLDARRTLEKVLELDGQNIHAHQLLGIISFNNGDIKDAAHRLEIIKGVAGIRPDHWRLLQLQALLLAKEGKKTEALKLNKSIRIMSLLGMKDEFLATLESISGTSMLTIYPKNLLKDPIFDFVRDEPEFKTILQRETREYEMKAAKYGQLD